ncbi:hypothetical protein Bbelb_005830 [Branchiostoma belcheri]|nr:hypothetical protein Bbelb_005830 [Branchiostoma belcheri]
MENPNGRRRSRSRQRSLSRGRLSRAGSTDLHGSPVLGCSDDSEFRMFLKSARDAEVYYDKLEVYHADPNSAPSEKAARRVSWAPATEQHLLDTGHPMVKPKSVPLRRASIMPTSFAPLVPLPPFQRERAASVAGSVLGSDTKKGKLPLWPEWNDNDVNSEKWDASHKGKDKEKGKSPSLERGKRSPVQHFFEDPEGKVDLPISLRDRVKEWKRPFELVGEGKPATVVEKEDGFDLVANSAHLHDSELMRWIISQIMALWKMTENKTPPTDVGSRADPNVPDGRSWRPWDHIYSLCKAGKGPHQPLYNAHGKYVIKLYWMGCWRKLIVDDTLPFDGEGNMLLPSTTILGELWPMLLTKAIVKIVSLDYNGGLQSCEFGEASIIHCLTGWLPETIPLQYGHQDKVWLLLKDVLPEFTLPEPPPPAEPAGQQPDLGTSAASVDTAIAPSRKAETRQESEALSRVDSVRKDDPKSGQTSKAEKGEKGGKEQKEDKKKKEGEGKDREKSKSAGRSHSAVHSAKATDADSKSSFFSPSTSPRVRNSSSRQGWASPPDRQTVLMCWQSWRGGGLSVGLACRVLISWRAGPCMLIGWHARLT